jgi:hypothetical protein
VPATLIPFPQYDRRARHAVISEVSALDLANDVDALAATAITYLEPSHLLALGHNDAELVRGIAAPVSMTASTSWPSRSSSIPTSPSNTQPAATTPHKQPPAPTEL